MLPNFLIFGAPRSGTTFLLKCLVQHPDIYMPKLGENYSTGDVHFFDVCAEEGRLNYAKGLSWYMKLFDDVTNEKAIGEKTAAYLADPKAPTIIKEHLGSDIRLIAILRNPVDRAYSHYWHVVGNIPRKVSFLDACRSERTKELRLIESGLYYGNIMRYLNYFDREQFLFLIHDDLTTQPLQVVQSAYEFLKVDSNFIPAGYNQKINTAIARGLPYYLKISGAFVKRRFPNAFKAMKNMPGSGILKKEISNSRGLGVATDSGNTNINKSQYPDMTDEEREELMEIYREDVRHLSSFLGHDLYTVWLER